MEGMTGEVLTIFALEGKANVLKIKLPTRTLKQLIRSASEWHANVILILCIKSAFSII
jgi:hypothetical protein